MGCDAGVHKKALLVLMNQSYQQITHNLQTHSLCFLRRGKDGLTDRTRSRDSF